MEEERISIIVPVYNVVDYLPRCLSCIEKQTYKNLEIILVDDGSSDGSGRLCDEFVSRDPRARVIHHPENIGLWAARNTGQDAAHGEYIWMPDGDDYFHKDIVRLMHKAINQTNTFGKKYDMAIVSHRRTDCLDEDILYEIESPSFVEMSLEEVLKSLTIARPAVAFNCKSVWSKLLRKELIKDIRTGNYKFSQDLDFSIKVYLKNPDIVFVNKELYFWVRRPSSAMGSQDWWLNANYFGARILYDNFRAWQGGENKFLQYMLKELYIRMTNLLEFVQGKNNRSSIRNECRKMVRHTWMAYLNCKEIKTFRKRLFKILKIRFDRLYRVWVTTGIGLI